MILPTFFVAGCQKCATTSMHYLLTQHQKTFLPTRKESKFFVIDERYDRGLEYYSRNFDKKNDEIAIGEVDPDYIYFKRALIRIKKHFDIHGLKFIFIFRNPVERAFSHYLMTYRRGIETKSFADAIDCEQERINVDFFSKMHFSYTDRGFYHRQLLPFMEILRPDQMLFLLTEDLKSHRDIVLKKCFEFLGVDNNFPCIETDTVYHKATIPRSNFLLNEIVRKQDTFPKKIVRLLIPKTTLRHKIRAKILESNQTSDTRKISLPKKEQLRLIALYGEENKKLATLLGRDLSHWNQIV